MAKLLPNAHDNLPKWECETCSNPFALSDLHCDHINAIGNTTPQNIEEFMECFQKLESTELQILCKNCHKMKTKQDAYEKKYNSAVSNTSEYLGIASEFITQSINSQWSIIQKFDRVVKKIKLNKENPEVQKKYLNKLDRLKEKYL